MTLFLHGLGHFHPENEITNRFLEELDIGTNDEWIMERVGIRSRRTLLPLDYIRETRNRDPRRRARRRSTPTPSSAGAPPRWRSRAPASTRSDIGMVIAGSSVPDFVSPADACNDRRGARARGAGLRRELRLHQLPRGAAPAVADGSREAAGLRAAGRAGEADPHRRLQRPQRRRALGRRGVRGRASRRACPAAPQILGSTLESSPAGRDKVVIPRHGHFRQEGRTVQTFAIKKTVQLLRAAARGLRRGRTPLPLRRPPGQPADAREGVRALRRAAGAAPLQRRVTSATPRAPARSASSACAGRSGPRRRRRRRGRRRRAHLVELPAALRSAAGVKYDDFRAARELRQRRSCSPSPTGGWSRTRPRASRRGLPLPPMLMVDRIVEIQRERHGAASWPSATSASTTGSSSATSSAIRCSRAASASTPSGS